MSLGEGVHGLKVRGAKLAFKAGYSWHCEGENSLKPRACTSINCRAKEYLVLPPSFYEQQASVLENIVIPRAHSRIM